MRRLLGFLLVTAAAAAPHEPVFPPGVKPVGPYSPGITTDTFLYVSGQGAQDTKGQIPTQIEAQVRQCLENVQAVVQAAGLTMEHVVLTHVYLTDMKNFEAMNRVYAKFFPKDPPARTTVGVARMPLGTPVEISAVAVRDVKLKKAYHYAERMPEPVSPAVEVANRVYLTGGFGRDESGRVPKQARDQVRLVMDEAEKILKQARLELRHLLHATIYVTPKMPMKLLAEAVDYYIPSETAKTIVQTSSLPFGVDVQISGVASRDMQRLGNCTAIRDTVYCSGRVGTIRQVLESIKLDLQANGTSMDNVVAVNVLMDDIDQFAAMNKVYAGYFGKIKPTRTTVQPWKKVAELALPPATGVAPEDDSPRCQVTVVAIR